MILAASYVEQFSRAISYEKIDFTGAIMLTFGAMLAILLLFLIAKVVKKITESRVRHIHYIGMDFDDVEKMHKEGLISDQEYRRIKSSLSRQALEQAKPPEEKPKGNLKSIPLEEEGKLGAERVAPEPQQPSSKASATALTIEDMRKAGLISEDEYRELSSFFKPEGSR
jgi:uncharacterized membrane protein